MTPEQEQAIEAARLYLRLLPPQLSDELLRHWHNEAVRILHQFDHAFPEEGAS